MIFVRLMNEKTKGSMIRNFIMEALWNDVEFRSKKLGHVSFLICNFIRLTNLQKYFFIFLDLILKYIFYFLLALYHGGTLLPKLSPLISPPYTVFCHSVSTS